MSHDATHVTIPFMSLGFGQTTLLHIVFGHTEPQGPDPQSQLGSADFGSPAYVMSHKFIVKTNIQVSVHPVGSHTFRAGSVTMLYRLARTHLAVAQPVCR